LLDKKKEGKKGIRWEGEKRKRGRAKKESGTRNEGEEKREDKNNKRRAKMGRTVHEGEGKKKEVSRERSVAKVKKTKSTRALCECVKEYKSQQRYRNEAPT